MREKNGVLREKNGVLREKWIDKYLYFLNFKVKDCMPVRKKMMRKRMMSKKLV